MPPGTSKELRVIRVEIDAPGVKKALNEMASGFGQVNRNIKETNAILQRFQAFGLSLGAGGLFGFGLKELTGIADGIQLTRDRISALLGPSVNAAEVFEKLARVADETRTGFSETGETFARVAVATKSLKLSADAMLSITSILNKSFLLSGASAAEASGSTIQFAQALSFGQLRGQELRSVLSQNAVLANVFREAIKGSGQDIYKFAEAGGFTTKFVLKALAENFVQISKDADKLGRTFDQSLTLAMNKLKLAIGDLNKEAGLSKGFAKFIDFLIEKTPQVITLLGVLAVSTIPTLTTALIVMGTAASKNPATALFIALGTTLVGLAFTVDDFSLKMQKGLLGISFFADKATKSFYEFLAATPLLKGSGFSKESDEIQRRIGLNEKEARVSAKQIEQINTEIARNEQERRNNRGKGNDYAKQAADFAKAAAGIADKQDPIEIRIGKLNKAFQDGSVDVAKYNQKITELQKTQLAFKRDKGQITQAKYLTEVAQLEFENVSRMAEKGKANFAEVEAARKNFKIAELNQKFKEGKNEVREYNIEVAKLGRSFGERLYVELQEYVQRTGDLFQGLSRGVVQVFGHLEDAIFDFTKTGRFDFHKFAQAVLDDLNRILIRTLIIRAIAQGISGAAGGGAGAVTVGTQAGGSAFFNGPNPYENAKGNAYAGGRLQAFATGGVVNQPTYFGFNGGQSGVMGEKSAEGILPLRRMGNGDLGVQSTGGMTVNIYNEAGASIETRESVGQDGERQLEVFILNTVRRGVDSGALDGTFKANFGNKRLGK